MFKKKAIQTSDAGIIMTIKEFYSDLWNELNWFGKVALFPIVILCFPLYCFIFACFKEN